MRTPEAPGDYKSFAWVFLAGVAYFVLMVSLGAFTGSRVFTFLLWLGVPVFFSAPLVIQLRFGRRLDSWWRLVPEHKQSQFSYRANLMSASILAVVGVVVMIMVMLDEFHA